MYTLCVWWHVMFLYAFAMLFMPPNNRQWWRYVVRTYIQPSIDAGLCGNVFNLVLFNVHGTKVNMFDL